MLNKKLGQIGETMTWFVATVIIVVILLISIFVATSFLSKNKEINFVAKQNDILASESFFAYLLTEDDSGQIVYNQIKNSEGFNDFNGNFALEIFEEFYSKDYSKVWLGIAQNVAVAPSIKNDYFGKDPGFVNQGAGGASSLVAPSITKKPSVIQIIPLDEEKSIKLVLVSE